MAQCKECKTKVGCGCQLKEGLCPACYSKKQAELKTVPKPTENVR